LPRSGASYQVSATANQFPSWSRSKSYSRYGSVTTKHPTASDPAKDLHRADCFLFRAMYDASFLGARYGMMFEMPHCLTPDFHKAFTSLRKCWAMVDSWRTWHD